MEKRIQLIESHMESVERVYNTRLSRFGELKTESLHSLTSVLDAADIKVHVISSRVKTLESVLGKLERQSGSAGVESTLSEPRSDDAVLDSIRDIVGLRVVCLFRSQLADVGKLLSQAFEVLEEDRKTERSDVDHFGYLSDHYICQLSEELRGPRYDHIKKMPFEVQVRTIGMDAWAAVSHHLDYKSDAGVPKNLLKDFYALSGLYFVADTQFAEIYRRAQELRSELQVAVDTKSTSLPSEINVETLYAFLKKRYPDRTTKIEAVEPLIAELQRSDIKSLDQLSHLLDRGHEAFLQLEAEDPPLVGRAGKKGRYLSTGAARVTLDLVVDGYFERRTQKGGGPKRKALIAKYQKLVPA